MWSRIPCCNGVTLDKRIWLLKGMVIYDDLQNKWKWSGKQLENTLYPSLKGVELRLELSNICNHACIFCPNRKMGRIWREMDEMLVRDLIQQGVGRPSENPKSISKSRRQHSL